MTFVVDQEDLDLAVAAVVFVVGGAVGEDVLVADGVIDLAEDVGERALEEWAEAQASGHRGEGVELVLCLEIVHLADAAAGSHLIEERSGADGEDGDVWSRLDLGEDLVEGELGEGVAAGADEDDVLAAFDATGAVEGLVESVEEVGFLPGGDNEGLETLGDQVLVVGEVGEDVGVHVVGDDGDVVVFAEGAEEVVGGGPHVVDEVVAVGGELEEHDRGDGGLGDADAGNGLGDAVFEDEKVFCLEAGDELVSLVEDDVGVDVDDGDVDAEGVGVVVGVLDLGGLGSRRRGWLVGLLLFLEDDGAVVGGWTLVVGGRLGGGFLLLGRGWGVLRGPGGGRREEDGSGKQGAGGAEEDAGRGIRVAGHHVKLYSECWTGLKGQGEI